MSECLDFPPCFFFQIAIKHCPEAALLYKNLWIYGDGQICNDILKEHIEDIFSISPKIFKKHLSILKENKLLEFQEDKKSYSIDLTPWDKIQSFL